MTTLQNIKAGWGRVVLLSLAAAAALVLIGVHDGEAGAAGGKAKVKIVGFAFKPGKLTVSRGTKVVFSNTTHEGHTATAKSFDTKVIAPGTSKAVTFNHAGTFAYHCTIHPFMKGTIVVR